MRPSKGEHSIVAYADADFAGNFHKGFSDNPSTAYSQSGFVITYAGCPIVWQSKQQMEIALSSTESEYLSLSACLQDVIVIRRLLGKLRDFCLLGSDSPTVCRCTVFEDNKGCIELANAPKMRPRTRHISTKYHHFRSKVGKEPGQIQIKYIETDEQIADQFTKALTTKKFEYFRKKLIGW